MSSTNKKALGRTLDPDPASQASQPDPSAPPTTGEQIAGPGGGYAGPERRARGVIIAEVTPEAETDRPIREPGA